MFGCTPTAVPGGQTPALLGRRAAAAALLVCLISGAGGQPLPPPTATPPVPAASARPPARPMLVPTPALDLAEAVHLLPVAVPGRSGDEVRLTIPITLYRPRGEGRFPLAIVNHGRGGPDDRRGMGRSRFEPLARYLVSKGFAVAVPTRAGYGETFGRVDPENMANCSVTEVAAAGEAAASQVLAAVAYLRTLPSVDASRWLAVGQSVGGMTALAVAARNPEGLVGVINFAGGSGGNPYRSPGRPCRPQSHEQIWRERAGNATVPTLWLYWENDLYWGAEVPRRWAQAWAEGGGKVEFHQLPAIGNDGHAGIGIDMNRWVPVVEPWLATLGFTQRGEIARPPASRHAQVDDIDKVPVPPHVRDGLYRRFLAARHPRAFAVGPDGAAGFAAGDWALGRALGFCQRSRGQPCKLYAVDDEVVWTEQ